MRPITLIALSGLTLLPAAVKEAKRYMRSRLEAEKRDPANYTLDELAALIVAKERDAQVMSARINEEMQIRNRIHEVRQLLANPEKPNPANVPIEDLAAALVAKEREAREVAKRASAEEKVRGRISEVRQALSEIVTGGEKKPASKGAC